MRRSGSNAIPLGLLMLMPLFWCGLVGLFDVILISQKAREMDARSRFVEVDATVSSSMVVTESSGDGTSFKPVIEYRYTYEGVEHLSDRYSFSIFSSSDRGHAHGVVDAHPEGATIVAYVDPDEPDEAVLDIDGTSFPTFLLLFLTPFHCAGLWMLGRLGREVRRRRQPARSGPQSRFVAVDRPDHLVIRKPRLRAWEFFLFALGLLTFLAIFPLAFSLGMMGAGAYALPTLGGCAAGALVLTAWKRGRDSRPSEFLHVDRRLGVFAFPADEPGTPISAIQSLQVESRTSNVAINDVPQHDHRVFALIGGLEVDVFAFRGGPDEGADLRSLIANELGVAD